MRYGSRKFLIALASIASATFLAYIKGIDGAAYASVVICVVGAYVAGNVAQKATHVA